MSSPVVETVRTVPLILEKNIPMEVVEITGYPFDRDSESDGYLRSQLDDIAKRHPEIAEHLENFAQRDRQRSNPSNEGQSLPRRFPRHFSDRFERFGFPFNSDDFDPEHYTHQFYQPEQESSQPHTQNYSTYQQQTPSENTAYSQSAPAQNSSSAPEPDRNNLQQSSTFDLGQKQEPVDDRGQRSQSAPPSENTADQPLHSENMSQSHSETKSSNERIIPIHIEGRNEPVLPKNVPPSYSQQHSTTQPERIFGKPTEHFTQFLPHERDARFSNNWHQGFAPEEHMRQQRFHPQGASQKKSQECDGSAPPNQKGEIPIPVHREVPAKQQGPTQQQTASPPEQPKGTQSKPPTPIEQIQAIQKDVSSLMTQVETFTGKSKDKQYLYLDEMLTRNLIKLDNIDTQGQENIRSARKEAIKCIEKAISVLEAKATATSETDKKDSQMDVEDKPAEENLCPNSTNEQQQKEMEPMETETCSSKPSIDESQQIMETSEARATDDTKTTIEIEVNKSEDEAKPPVAEQTTLEKVPVEKEEQENTSVSQDVDTKGQEKENVEENKVPEQDQITDNTCISSGDENQSNNAQSSTDGVSKDDDTKNSVEDKNEKQDKKKSKKKSEKKEK